MPDNSLFLSIVVPAGFIFLFAVYGFAAYWGIAIRRKLVMGAYRAQALGVGAVAIYFFVIGLANSTFPVVATSTGIPVYVNALVDSGYLAIILYWIHTTIAVSKRSDPFERDTLRYSITRYIWVLVVASFVAISLVYNPIGLVITVAVPLSSFYLALALAPWVAGASFGGVLLLLGASRSMDRTLRSHIRWLGIFALVSLVNIVAGGAWRESGGDTGAYIAIIFPFFVAGQAIAAYCLYRSARSLAPIAKSL
jgi:hypothetical protein